MPCRICKFYIEVAMKLYGSFKMRAKKNICNCYKKLITEVYKRGSLGVEWIKKTVIRHQIGVKHLISTYIYEWPPNLTIAVVATQNAAFQKPESLRDFIVIVKIMQFFELIFFNRLWVWVKLEVAWKFLLSFRNQ